MLYESLTGERAFPARTPPAVMAQQLTDAPPSATTLRREVPEAVERVIQKALRSTPADRFGSAAEFTEALEAAREGSEARGAGHADLPRRTAVAAAVVLVVCALAWGGFALLPGGDIGGDADTAAAPLDANDGLPVLAVLPFANRSELSEDEHFTDGIHDQVLTELSKRGGFRLLSRTSVQEYRDSDKRTPEIAAELGATHLVEGAVQRAGDSVLVTSQLVDATDQHLWSNDYQRKLTVANLFGIQRELAGRVARELGLQLVSSDDQDDGIPTESIEAWDVYQMATLVPGTDPLPRIQLFQEAVRLDSSFLEAWAGLADAYAVSVSTGSRLENRPLAHEALRRARELDPDHMSVLGTEMTIQYVVEYDFQRVLEIADELRQRSPNSGIYAKARVHERLGQWDEAFAEYEMILQRNPRSFTSRPLAAHLAAGARRFDLARRHFERFAIVARNEDDREHAERALAMLPVLERTDTAAALRELQARGLEIETCGPLSFPHLRRQFDRAYELCQASGGSAQPYMAMLAHLLDDDRIREAEAVRIRQRAEDRIAHTDSVGYAEFRYPRASGFVSLAASHALRGDSAEAARAARHAMEISTPRNDVRDLARLAARLVGPYIMIGDHEAALEMMEIAARGAPAIWQFHLFSAAQVRLDPMYDPLRAYPRFEEILRRLEEAR